MASVGTNLKTYLKTISGVTALVGAGAAARIYTNLAKQGVATPYRIQVDCYGATEAEAYNLAEAVRLAPLQMYRGTFGDADAVAIISPDGYRQGIDNPSKGGNQRRYWISRDFTVTYREAVS